MTRTNTIWMAFTATFLAVLAIYLRGHHIESQSLWLDELFSATYSNPKHSLHEAYIATVKDVHPPLFQMILWAAYNIFGFTEFGSRYLSMAFGIAFIPAIYLLAKEMFDKNVALLAAIFSIFNFYFIRYSQEGRSYTLFVLLVVVSFYFFMRMTRERTKATAAWYAIATALLVNTHYFAALILIAQGAVFIAFCRAERDLKLFITGTVACALGVLSLAPSAPYIAAAAGRGSFWAPKPDGDFLIGMYTAFFGSTSAAAVYMALAIAGVALCTANSRQKLSSSILLTWSIIPVVIVYLKSVFGLPMFIDRYMIICLPPLILLASYAISKVHGSVPKVVISLLCVALSVGALKLPGSPYYTKERWKAQWDRITEHAIKNPSTPIYADLSWLFNTYLELKGSDIRAKSIESLEKEISTGSQPKEFLVLDAHTMKAKRELSQYRQIGIVSALELNFASAYRYRSN